MAGRKLTDEEKAHYNERMAMTRASKEKEAAAKAGNNPKPSTNTRSFDQIMSDIEKVKQDPKFQAKIKKYQEAQAAKGTQADHHITDNSSHTQPIGGMVIKTPIDTKTESTIKTPEKPNISLINKTPVASKTNTTTKTPVKQQGKTIDF